jgi:DNA-binding NtrC family response regulator
MISYSLWLVDDDPMVREGVKTALEDHYEIKTFETADAMLEDIPKSQPDLVLLDIGLPGMNGIEALKQLKVLNPETLVVMITAYDDIDTVIASMKLGAHDYVVKPLHMDALEVTIRNALETIRLRKEVQAYQEKYLKENVPCFIGESRGIQDIMQFVEAVAKSPDTPVLILGETGTGKELIAGAIHYRSPNFKGPLITVNCASIPKDLIDSELFGYERGAFSGASSSGKKGLIEEAAGGTLFLDEVGDMSLEAQAKLLRFLEDGEYYRIGGTKKFTIKTRVISATNRDVDSMIQQGLFRKDLYFRLGVIRIEIPSLTNRREDIIPIAHHFLVELSRKVGKALTGISPQAEEALKNLNWPGNVRELKNLIEKGVLVSKGPELTLQDLGVNEAQKTQAAKDERKDRSFPPISPAGIDFPSVQDSIEKYYIEEALHLTAGNESKAARLLNLNHHTFRYRRRKLQIP